MPSLNENLLILDCSHNHLSSLPSINEKLHILDCSHNNLTSLPELNKNLSRLICHNNNLFHLPKIKHLMEFRCDPCLSTIQIPTIQIQRSSYSRKTLPKYKHIPSRTEILYATIRKERLREKNRLEILDDAIRKERFRKERLERLDAIDAINNNQIINRFRVLFYCLKFKEKFRNWLHIKVRLPKTERMNFIKETYEQDFDESKDFNIEEYLDSLPNDIDIIDVSHKSLSYLPSLKRFYRLRYLDCSNNNLTSLPSLNNSLKSLYCQNNQLIILPELNNSLNTLCCSNNKIISLPILNHSLQNLYCENNQLTFLPILNQSLKQLVCDPHLLNEFPDLMKIMRRSHKPILLNENKKNDLNKFYQFVHRFRSLFYYLKFKEKLRNWLWLKVRLPKTERMYHPDKLKELFDDREDISDNEFHETIENW